MANSEPSPSNASPQDPAVAHRPAQATPELHDLRVNIARIVGRYFLPLLGMTFVFAALLVVIIATRAVSSDTAEKMALAASIQVAFGMVIGYVCVYIGLMMTWFGIEASYDVKGAVGTEAAKGELSLKSASPGLLFALGGMILIAVCLYKPIVYEAEVPFIKVPLQPPSRGSLRVEDDSDADIVPNKPPPFDTSDNTTPQ